MLVLATLALIAVAVSAFLLVRRMRGRLAVVTVHGPSMIPALQPGDRVLVRRASLDTVRRGDMVMVARPSLEGSDRWAVPGVEKSAMIADDGWVSATGTWLIKRVAAVPGDEVPRELVPALSGADEQRVPAGRFVVLGDNAELSFDSRTCGYFTDEQLWGLVLKRIET